MTILPFQRNFPRKTLVIDLDHTLVDTVPISKPTALNADYTYTDSAGRRAKVFLRPYVLEFLQKVREHFEVVLFTAAPCTHADAVLAILDPRKNIFEYRLYLQHTSPSPEWPYVKDLSRLGRNLSQTLLVDDCRVACLFQMQNWVGVPAFHQGPDAAKDTSLKELLPFLLEQVLPAQDVRAVIAQGYDNKMRCPIPVSPAAAAIDIIPEKKSLVAIPERKSLIPSCQSAAVIPSPIAASLPLTHSISAVQTGLTLATSDCSQSKDNSEASTPESSLTTEDTMSRASSWESEAIDNASELVASLALTPSGHLVLVEDKPCRVSPGLPKAISCKFNESDTAVVLDSLQSRPSVAINIPQESKGAHLVESLSHFSTRTPAKSINETNLSSAMSGWKKISERSTQSAAAIGTGRGADDHLNSGGTNFHSQEWEWGWECNSREMSPGQWDWNYDWGMNYEW